MLIAESSVALIVLQPKPDFAFQRCRLLEVVAEMCCSATASVLGGCHGCHGPIQKHHSVTSHSTGDDTYTGYNLTTFGRWLDGAVSFYGKHAENAHHWALMERSPVSMGCGGEPL